jgi:hypothetical protein
MWYTCPHKIELSTQNIKKCYKLSTKCLKLTFRLQNYREVNKISQNAIIQ